MLRIISIVLIATILVRCGSDSEKSTQKKSSNPSDTKTTVDSNQKKQIQRQDPSEFLVYNFYDDEGLQGYQTADKTPIFGNKRFQEANPFVNGFAKVGERKNGVMRYTFIDDSGKEIGPYKYHAVGNFNDSLAWVQEEDDGKYGYINTSGELILPLAYENNYDFSNGL